MLEYGDWPSVLVIANSELARDRATLAAEQAGCRVVGMVSIGEGLERLDRQAAVNAVLVEVDADEGDPLLNLLDRLRTEARSFRLGVVINYDASLMDLVAARTLDSPVQHLCDPSEFDRAAAIAVAASPNRARLHEARREPGGGRLQQLSEEVGRIASILAGLSQEEERGGTFERVDEEDEPISVGQIRAIIRARRLRDQFFKSDFFADPAWDMLLDLMAARVDGQRVAVSSLCIAASVPPTTALRWIKTLTDHGLFLRCNDPQDGRRVYIELAEHAAGGMTAYLKAAQRIAPIVV